MSNKDYFFPENLKRERKKANLTQEQLAEKMFCNTHTICNWETGRTIPNAKDITALTKVLNCTCFDLLVEYHEDYFSLWKKMQSRFF